MARVKFYSAKTYSTIYSACYYNGYGMDNNIRYRLKGDLINDNFENNCKLYAIKNIGDYFQERTINFNGKCFVCKLKNGYYVFLQNTDYLTPTFISDGHGGEIPNGYEIVKNDESSIIIDGYQNDEAKNTISLNYQVKGLVLVNGYCYVYLEEIDQEKTFETETILNTPVEIEPYQPIASETLVVDAQIKRHKVKFNSTKVISDLEATPIEITKFEPPYFKSFATTLPEYGEFKVEPIEKFSSNSNKGITLRAGAFKNIEYFIKNKGDEYSVYVGKSVGEDFLKNFSFCIRKWNNYKTIETTIHNQLDPRYLAKTIYSQGDNVEIEYTYDSHKAIYSTGKQPIGLAAGKDAFQYIVVKKSWKFDDILDLKKLDFYNKESHLMYSDGTKISFTELKFNSASATTDLKNPNEDGTYTLVEGTPDFNITLNYDINYFGKLTYTYLNTVKGEGTNYAVSGKVDENTRIHFNYGEKLEFGVGAKLKLFNINGELIETIPIPDVSVSTITELPLGYGERIGDNMCLDIKQNRKFRVKNRFDVPWDVTVNYFDSFAIDVSKVNKVYYVENDFVLDEKEVRANIEANIVYHNNESVLGSTTAQKVAPSQLVFDYERTSVENENKIFVIKVKFVDDYKREHLATFQVTAVKIIPISLRLNGKPSEETITYWGNNQDKFKIPSGFTYQLVMNYGDPRDLSADYAIQNFEYYRNKDCTGLPLTTDTPILVGEGNRVRIKDRVTGVKGSYVISFKEDEVVSVAFSQSQQKVNLILGNKFNSIKDQLNLVCTYASGVISTIPMNEYDFEEIGLINAPTDIVINYRNKSYNLGREKIIFVEPEVENVEFILNGFKSSYTNMSDNINCSPLKLKVTYKDSEYVQNLDFSIEPIDISKTTYNVSSDKVLNTLVAFAFDGSTTINTDMGNFSQITVPLKFTFNEALSNKTYTALYYITILEVLDIVGISLKNIKTDYFTGETFLNENDDTIVTIFFKDKSGNQQKLDVKLNSGFAAINILPAIGTKLKNVTNSLKVQVTSATNFEVKAEYSITVSPKIQNSNTKKHKIVALHLDDYNGIIDKYFLIDMFYKGQKTTKLDSSGQNILDQSVCSLDDIEVYGYIDDYGDESKNAKIVLFKDYIPPIDGTNNIEVKYPCYVRGNADLINKCHLGTLFGSNNSRNRLFLAGNKESPNFDWHSAAIKENSFGYFEDTSFCTYGETDSAITGYAKVADNKLLVLKSKSDKDSTVWFRIPTMVTAISGSGEPVLGFDGQVLHQEEFSLIKGNNSVAGVSPKSILNFNGDTLFLSEEKSIVGLDLVGIIGDNQRYANTRSYYIDWELKQIANEKTWLWSNNKYLFIVLEDKVYVSHFETFHNKQYEWLPINIADVKAIIELDNVIYFGNSNGQFYKINNIYDDVSKIFIGDNGSTLVTQENDDNKVIVSRQIIDQLEEGKKYRFKTIPVNNDPSSYMYYKIGRISNENVGTFDFYVNSKRNTLELRCYVNGKVDFDRLNVVSNSINEDRFVYLNHVEDRKQFGVETIIGGDPLRTYYKKYKFIGFEDEYYTSPFTEFKLYDEQGNEMNIQGLIKANLCYRLDGEYKIGNIHKDTTINQFGREIKNSYFNLYINDQLVDLVQYADQGIRRSFKAEITHYKPVECFYITKPYTMGSLDYFKTIWQSTLTNDTNIPSEIELTYVDNKIPFERMKTISKISVESLSLDFSDLSFTKLDLMKTNVPRTYTITGVMPNLKSITFGFRNYNNTNAVLCSMSIVYSVPMQSYSGD